MNRLFALVAAFALTASLAYAADKPASASPGQSTRAGKPNLVVIIADDLGYGDVGFNGAKPTSVKTPNIDRLASEGLRFTSGYCSASTCTPTRFSLLTGTYAFRVKGTGIAAPAAPAIIQPGTATLPSLLKQAGYATAAVGKWHLGLGGPDGPNWNGKIKPGPLDIGFDYAFLMPTTNDRVPQVYLENDHIKDLDPNDPLWVGSQPPSPGHPTGVNSRSTLRMDWSNGHNNSIHNGIGRIGFYTGGEKARFRDEDLADAWVGHSVKWMEEHKDQPFFLYFASHDIHVPRMPNERFQGKSPMGYRGDVIEELDWCVGELMSALDRLKLTDDTLIVFCSDNGPVLDDGYKDGAVEKLGDHKPAGPYSGGKYSIQEGGTRTPFVTRWPGTIKPGSSDQIVCTIDLAASMAGQLKVSIPKEGCLDSINVWDALLGKPGAKGRPFLLEQDNGGNNLGFRQDHWKLQKHAGGGANKKAKAGKGAKGEPTFELFDLTKDPAEKTDVSGAHPDVLKQMKATLQKAVDDGRTRQE